MLSAENRHLTAIHEAGHAFMTKYLGAAFECAYIADAAIAQRCNHLGLCRSSTKYKTDGSGIIEEVMTNVAGALAEQLLGLGTVDMKQHSGDRLNIRLAVSRAFFHYDDSTEWAVRRLEYKKGNIPEEVLRAASFAEKEAIQKTEPILKRNFLVVEEIAKRLEEKEIIYDKDIADLNFSGA